VESQLPTANLFEKILKYKIKIMKYLKSLCLLFLGISLLAISCESDDEINGTSGCNSDFDQEALFINLADNIIVTGYEDLQAKLVKLQTETNSFVGALDQVSLDNLRAAYLGAYVDYQKIAAFEFGPAETVFLRTSLNNFPTNVTEIENHIANNTTGFDQPDDFDKGFPAVDYLLFGIAETDESILYLYTAGDGYKDYLVALVTDMKERVDQTLDGWNTDYRETFVKNTGTAAGSSLSLIINGLNENYELIKRQKLGIPSGVLTLGFLNPTEVEAFYSGNSVLLAKAGLEATVGLYKGYDGIGLDDYLQDINAMKGSETLDAAIQGQFITMIEKVSALEDPLSEMIEADVTPLVEAYNEVAKQLVNIKTDMPSVLCVSITYIDNPSDSD
jgi:predicted lipoprotein